MKTKQLYYYSAFDNSTSLPVFEHMGSLRGAKIKAKKQAISSLGYSNSLIWKVWQNDELLVCGNAWTEFAYRDRI